MNLVAEYRDMVVAITELLLEEETVDADSLDFVCSAVEEQIDWRENLKSLEIAEDDMRFVRLILVAREPAVPRSCLFMFD